MARPRALALLLVVAALAGLVAFWRAAPGADVLACPEGQAVSLGPDGVARCGPGAELPPGQALTVGQKFDCNRASAEELALVPGVGASLARAIVDARDGGFGDWSELDAVPGVGPTRLLALQAACELRWPDAGLW